MTGVLRGFDPYMNIVLDDAMEERTSSEKYNIGMVVSFSLLRVCVELDYLSTHPPLFIVVDHYVLVLSKFCTSACILHSSIVT